MINWTLRSIELTLTLRSHHFVSNKPFCNFDIQLIKSDNFVHHTVFENELENVFLQVASYNRAPYGAWDFFEVLGTS
jgi:hypothetical protein